jgi:hypothetical protein
VKGVNKNFHCLEEAVSCFEKVMTGIFGKHFENISEPIKRLLDGELSERFISAAYLRFELDAALHEWSLEVRSTVGNNNTPQRWADLLKSKFVSVATVMKEGSHAEFLFSKAGGIQSEIDWSKAIYDEPTNHSQEGKTAKSPSVGDNKREGSKGHSKRENQSGTEITAISNCCRGDLLGALGVKNNSGKNFFCKHKSKCRYLHVSKNIKAMDKDTLKEMVEAVVTDASAKKKALIAIDKLEN